MNLFSLFCAGWVGVAGYSAEAWAHPVAFRGSTGIMAYQSRAVSDWEINHSLTTWFAPSVQRLRFTEGTGRADVHLAKANFLAKRWNGRDHQANLYLQLGAGPSTLSGARRAAYALGGVADIENRRLYFLTQAMWLRSGVGTEMTEWKVRGGFAPYVVDFEQLHTWLILEAHRKSMGDRRVEIVPYLRFFYQNVLWELGASARGDMHLNFIIHI